MYPDTSIHVHTLYCDGKNNPRELIGEALRLGLKTLGFSGHSPSAFAGTSGMSLRGMKDYIAEITALKAEFSPQIEIVLGVEQDYYSNIDGEDFDYVIGSVHSIQYEDGRQFVMDGATEDFQACAEAFHRGDSLSTALNYYKTYVHMLQTQRPKVAGHLDVITKVTESLFSQEDPAYRRAALEAAECAWQSGAVIEVNTGGMARGYTKTPYPAPFILRQLAQWKAPVTITSDCHRKEFLCHFFPESLNLLKECGFRVLHQWKNGSFTAEEIL